MSTCLTIPVALSSRHVHLSRPHVEALFGPDHRLCELRPLSQPGQYASRETVELVGPRGSIPGVRVLGPERAESQVELSVTDGYVLGIQAPVRVSGDTAGTPGGHLIGPRGAVKLEQGFIVAARHIHLEPGHAELAGLRDRQAVAVRVVGRRGLVFDEVVVRISPEFRTELHLDTDEGNAASVRNGDMAEVLPDVCALCPVADCDIRPDASRQSAGPYCGHAEDNLRIL